MFEQLEFDFNAPTLETRNDRWEKSEIRNCNVCGKVSTDTMQMLKHTATEVVEAAEAYMDYGYINKPQSKRVFASELADIVCCVLIIAGKENIDMEYALTTCMEKNYKRAIGKGDK